MFLQEELHRFEELEQEALKFSNTAEYRPTKGRPRNNSEMTNSFKDNFKGLTFDVIIDELIRALQKRQAAYQEIYNRFKAVVELCNLPEEDLRLEGRKLSNLYLNDLTDLLVDE